MKTIKYFILVVVSAMSLSACVVHERSSLYVRGHYEIGAHGGRYWVPGHYDRR